MTQDAMEWEYLYGVSRMAAIWEYRMNNNKFILIK